VAPHPEAHATVHRRRAERAPQGRVEPSLCWCWPGTQPWHVEAVHRRCATSSSCCPYYHTDMAILAISRERCPTRALRLAPITASSLAARRSPPCHSRCRP
jgi:hypothetical protein